MPPSDERYGSSAEADTASAPFLSIVLTGRNDGYGGAFSTRFFRTLRFNHRELTARQVSHEIVFVEWAPPHDAPLLLEQIFDAIPDLDPAVCAWYVVDAQYQSAVSQNPRLEYLEFIAKNVGVRRARGRFVLTSNCDVFLGRHVLDVFERRALDSRVLYRAPRYDIELAQDIARLDWNVLEDPRILAGRVKPLKPPFMGSATGDFALLDRQTFHEIRGFNEVYRVARIGIDRNLLVKVLSSGIRIADIGGPVYHINHAGSYRLNRAAYAGREFEAPWGDRRWHQGGVSYVNPPTWGLSQAPARRYSERSWYLDFSWEAVPPLAHLRGVVLPVARRGAPFPGNYRKRR